MDNKEYNCEIIQDLLALYHDKVCSEESTQAVEQHLTSCEKCREMSEQLKNTTLENQMALQAESILKKHKRKQRRIIHIISMIAALLVIVMGVWMLFPRLAIYHLVSKTFPDAGLKAEAFESYNVTDDSLVTIEYSDFTIGIPDNYIEKEFAEDASFEMYHDIDNYDCNIVILKDAQNLEDINLLNASNYTDTASSEYGTTIDSDTVVKLLKKWFKSLGNGIPDSAFDTFKCVLLLDNNDKSIFNIGQNIAFAIECTIKDALIGDMDAAYIYETEEKCAIIRVHTLMDTQPNYIMYVDVYNTDDLNTCYSIIIRSNTLEETYPIINSIQFK